MITCSTRDDGITHRELLTRSGGRVATTITLAADDGTRSITFDTSKQYPEEFSVVCLNLTESETQDLIRNLVGTLNEFQRMHHIGGPS